MKMTNKEYKEYVEQKAPPTPAGKNVLLAFLSGGLICSLGQFCKYLYELAGLDKETAGSAVSITLIFLAALLTSVHWYDNISKHAGAGMLVPITGFANSMVSPAIEFKGDGLIAGLAAKMFSIAGPVIVFGLISSVLYGIVLVVFKIPITP